MTTWEPQGGQGIRRRGRLASSQAKRLLLRGSLCVLALSPEGAWAQLALPDINISKPKPKRVVAKPTPAPRQLASAHSGRSASSAPSAGANPVPAPAATGAATANTGPAPFLPPGQQIGRGPTGVVGYSASGTSTATKTNTPIMDIPQSITIVTQQQLKDRDSLTLQEALTYVPGVTVAGGEGNSDQIVIRGQSTTADFYKDGMRDDAEYIRDLYNIQAVEVLKGPSALTFGRGGAGGIVNRVTKKADGEPIQELDISSGSFGRKRVTIDWGGAVSGQFAARLNGMFEQFYGYRNFFADERYGISPTFTWKPDESTNVWLTYEHYRDRRTADRGINSVGLSSVFPDLPGDFSTILPGYPSAVPSWFFYGDANPSAAQVNYAKVDVNSVDLAGEHKTAFGLEIRDHILYADYQKRYQNTFTGEPVQVYEGSINGIEGYRHNTPRQNLINQLDFVYRFDMMPEVKHTIAFGGEVGHQTSQSDRDFACFDNDCAVTEVDTFYLSPTIYNFVNYGNVAERRHSDLLTASGYIQDQIAITQYIDVLAGVRYDRFDLKFVGNDYANPNIAAAGDADEGSAIINGYIRTVNNEWSPRVGVVLKPTPQLSLYGTYSRSFLPPSGDQFVLITPNLAGLSPQGIENYEVGFKAEPQPNLFFTGALYILNRSNQPLAVNSANFVAGNTQTKGGEIGLVGQLTDKWRVSLGYGHQIGIITANNGGAPDPTNPFQTDVGHKTPNVPLDAFSLWNKYDLSSLFDAGPGVLGAGLGVVYNAKFYPEINNTVIVPGYARVDGALYVKLSEKVSAQLNVENLAGAHYYVAASANNNIMPGAPRSAFITLRAKF